MTDFTVDPEFAGLCPPLSDEERAGLEADLRAHGCREPLVVWKEEKIGRYATAGLQATDRTRLSSLGELRQKIDALDQELTQKATPGGRS